MHIHIRCSSAFSISSVFSSLGDSFLPHISFSKYLFSTLRGTEFQLLLAPSHSAILYNHTVSFSFSDAFILLKWIFSWLNYCIPIQFIQNNWFREWILKLLVNIETSFRIKMQCISNANGEKLYTITESIYH